MQKDPALERHGLCETAAPFGQALAWQAVEPQSLTFKVERNRTIIGECKVRVYRSELNWVVDTDIEMNVRLAFIKIYRYQHRNREVWDGAGLLRFDSITNDNGEEHVVSAERFGEQIRVAGRQGVIAVPHDSLPTTFWHRRFTDKDRWIDTQRGQIVESKVTANGIHRIAVMGEAVEAEHFILTGDLDLELWYFGRNWVKLRFRAQDGSMINLDLNERRGNILAGDLSEILAG